MKALLCAGLAFVSIWARAQPYTFTSLSEVDLKGKVKSVSFERFTVTKNNDGSIQDFQRGGSFNNSRISFYNPLGQIEREEKYKMSGIPEDTVLTHISKYIYEDGRIVKILNNGTFEELNNHNFIDYSVDYFYTNDTVYFRVMYSTLPDDTLRGISRFRYTISSYLHTIDQGVDPDNPFSSEKIYFDDAGRKVSLIQEQTGKVFSKCSFDYAGSSSLRPDFSDCINVENGRRTKTQYLYNEHKDIIAELEIDVASMTNKTTSFEYDYDHQGNWIEKRSLDESGQLKNLVRRSITYWE